MAENKKENTEKKDEKYPKDFEDDLRRLEISQMRILALKRPKEFKKIAESISLSGF